MVSEAPDEGRGRRVSGHSVFDQARRASLYSSAGEPSRSLSWVPSSGSIDYKEKDVSGAGRGEVQMIDMQQDGKAVSFRLREAGGAKLDGEDKKRIATKEEGAERFVEEAGGAKNSAPHVDKTARKGKKNKLHDRKTRKSHTPLPSTPPPRRETGEKVDSWKEEMDDETGEKWWVCEKTGARIMMKKKVIRAEDEIEERKLQN